MISLVDIGAGLWPFAHNSKNASLGGWWNDLDMIEIGNGGGTVQSGSVQQQRPQDLSASASTTMYPWAVAPQTAGANWSFTDGTIRNGGLCLTADDEVDLVLCTAEKVRCSFSDYILHLEDAIRSHACSHQ
jgi:hypothetical protein